MTQNPLPAQWNSYINLKVSRGVILRRQIFARDQGAAAHERDVTNRRTGRELVKAEGV